MVLHLTEPSDLGEWVSNIVILNNSATRDSESGISGTLNWAPRRHCNIRASVRKLQAMTVLRSLYCPSTFISTLFYPNLDISPLRKLCLILVTPSFSGIFSLLWCMITCTGPPLQACSKKFLFSLSGFLHCPYENVYNTTDFF